MRMRDMRECSPKWAVVAVMPLLLVGCSPIESFSNANPRRMLRVNPAQRSIDFYSNSDDTVETDGVVAKTPSGEFELKKTRIINNSSDVRNANVNQLQAWPAIASANYQGISQVTESAFNGLSQIVPYISPMLAAKALGNMPRSRSIPTPWGTMEQSSGFTDSQIQTLLSMAGTQVSQLPQPLPQPVGVLAYTADIVTMDALSSVLVRSDLTQDEKFQYFSNAIYAMMQRSNGHPEVKTPDVPPAKTPATEPSQ